jgi:hypothetical protein
MAAMNAPLRAAFFATFLAGLTSGTALAQPYVGVIGGFNSSHVSFDAGVLGSTSLEWRHALFGGITVVEPVRVPGLSVEIDGLMIQSGSGQVADDFQLELLYLGFPVMARVDVPLVHGRRLHVEVGPSFDFKLTERVRVDDDVSTELDAYKTLETSLIIGGGVDLGRFRLELRFSRGLSDIVGDQRRAGIPFAVKNAGVMFGVGYSFNTP